MIQVSLQNSELTTNWNTINYLVRLIIIIMEGTYLLSNLRSRLYTTTFFKIVLLLILAIFSGIQVKTYGYLNLLFLLILSLQITDSEFMDIFFKGIFFELLFCIFTWPVGILLGKERFIYGNQAYEIAEQRISWGTVHPNVAALIASWLLITYIIIQFKNNNHFNLKVLCSLLIAVIFQLSTKSAMFYYYYIFIIAVYLLKWHVFSKIVVKIGQNIFWIIGLFTYILVKAYSGWGPAILQKISQMLNIVSTERISMSSLALITNGITIFGSKTNFNNPLYNWTLAYHYQGFTIDVFYTYLGVTAGLIYFFLLSYGFFKLCKCKGTLFSLCVIVFSFFSLASVNMLFCTTTFVMFYMRDLIFEGEEISELHDFW